MDDLQGGLLKQVSYHIMASTSIKDGRAVASGYRKGILCSCLDHSRQGSALIVEVVDGECPEGCDWNGVPRFTTGCHPSTYLRYVGLGVTGTLVHP